MQEVTLKPGREKSLKNRHPWIFSGAIARTPQSVQTGETISIKSATGEFLAWGAISPESQIILRIWSFDPNEVIDDAFIFARVKEAILRRQRLTNSGVTDARRVIYGENDGLPGVIADQYASWLVVQFLSAGAEMHRKAIVAALDQLIPNEGIYERSDVDVRQKEGLPARAGLLKGDSVPPEIIIQENGLKLGLNIATGHKTGYYLDQRDNRAVIREFANDQEVLNCFSYSGGFGLFALDGGAKQVTAIDSSSDALGLNRRNLALNGLDSEKMELLQGDVFKWLRHYRDEGRQFDLIILDPPKFVENQKQLERGLRGYKDINWLAFRLLRPGGILFTFSCSGRVNDALFQKVVAGAALDAGRDAKIIRYLHQGEDHPVALNFPEGAYLKGLICQC